MSRQLFEIAKYIMSKSPPGVQRVVAVLNFFAEHPGQAFTFTDIVKALDLGRATCHALLGGLVDAQYLYRNRDKTYVIGPALAAIGKIAHEQFSPLQATQPELRALSDQFRTVCSAVYREGIDVIIRLRAGSGQQAAWSVPQGLRLLLRAPFAGAFFAVSKPYEIEKWLDQLSPAATDKEKEDLLAGIAFTKQHGFCFGERNDNVEHNVDSPEQTFSSNKLEFPVVASSSLAPNTEYSLAFITSPVFNASGQVEFVLNLSGFRGTAKGSTIEEMGNALRAAAERLTYFMNGRSEPYPFPA